jgi:type I restriction enzyme, S subunit
MINELPKLISFCEKISSGGTPSRDIKNYYENGSIPWVKSKELKSNIIWDTEEKITESGLRNSSAKIYPVDTVLLAMYGVNIGQVGYLGIKAAINQAICGIITNKRKLNPRFLYYYLKSIPSYFESVSFGAAQQNINQDLIKKLKIKTPDVLTQQCIANILSTYDSLIEINIERIRLLEEIARELYKEWFVRMRFPGHTKATFIKGLPKGWNIRKIGEVCKVARGSSPRPIVDQKYFANGNIPWVKIADATAAGKFLFETKEYVNEYGASFSRHLKPGSLIIATSGTLGFCIFLAIEACIHDGWLYTFDYEEGITPEFLFFVINDRTEYFNNLSYGAAIQNINTDILRKTSFLKPDKELLEKFQHLIAPIHEEQKNILQQNDQVRQIRDRLLPRLISGKLSLKHFESENAE